MSKSIRNLGVVSTQETIDEPASFDAIEGLGEVITTAPITYKSFQGMTLDSLRRVKPKKETTSNGVTLRGISRTEWLLEGCYSVIVKGIVRKRIHISLSQRNVTQRSVRVTATNGGVAAGGDIIGVVSTGRN